MCPLRSSTILLLFIQALPLNAEDWLMYLKDLSHSSFNASENQLNHKNIATLQPAWTFPLASQVASAVTVSNGILFFGDWDGYFHALDAHTGSEFWNTFLGKAPTPDDPNCQSGIGITSQAALVGNTLYVGGGDSAVYALDPHSGTALWRLPLADPAAGSYIWSSVVPYQNHIYAGVASLGDCPLVQGLIARIDPANPKQPLIQDLIPSGDIGAGLWTTPAINTQTNKLFLNTGNGGSGGPNPGDLSEAMVSLDAATLNVGQFFRLPSSEFDSDFDWGSSPVLFTTPGGTPLVAASGKDGVLYALRQDNMTLAWSQQLATECEAPESGCGSISTPAFDGSTLFAGAGIRDLNAFALGSLYAINPANGQIIWRRDTAGTIVAPVTIANGLLYAPTTLELEIYDAATGQFLWSDGNRGTLYGQAVVVNGAVYSTYFAGSVVAWQLPSGTDVLYSYSAATGLPSLAPGAIASAYGPNLESVAITDSSGSQYQTDVLAATSGQINYVVPTQTALGQATVTATNKSGNELAAVVQISQASPGLFSANADGQGVAAAQALIRHADGTTQYLPVFQCGTAPGSCTTVPIDLGAASDQVFLILYGTGISGGSTPANVACTIGAVQAPVLYAGTQGSFKGLDQVNVQVPRSLAGSGQVGVTLSVDSQLSNTVTIGIM